MAGISDYIMLKRDFQICMYTANAYLENCEDFWCKEQLFIYNLNQAAMFDIQVMAAFQEIILSSNFN